jgi:hypothetical protein
MVQLDGTFRYRQAWADPKPAPHNVIVEQLSPGPPRQLWFSGLTKKWEFDPGTIRRVILDDFNEATGWLTIVDRATAERVAAEMGQTLPDETELARMMDEGVARMTATDDWETPISFD